MVITVELGEVRQHNEGGEYRAAWARTGLVLLLNWTVAAGPGPKAGPSIVLQGLTGRRGCR